MHFLDKGGSSFMPEFVLMSEQWNFFPVIAARGDLTKPNPTEGDAFRVGADRAVRSFPKKNGRR
jgi:hypothetical protein